MATTSLARTRTRSVSQDRMAMTEYTVTWGDGPLGVTIRPELGDDMPPVVGRVTRHDSAAALAGVTAGDLLIRVNGLETVGQGYDFICDLLANAHRPVSLRFRSTSNPMSTPTLPPSSSSLPPSQPTGSSDATSYTIVWTEGPLGMILRPDDDDVHVACIRKLTRIGSATGIDRAAIGDALISVNGQEARALGFRSTIALLKTIRKPAVLKFKRMHRRERCPAAAPAMPPPNANEYDLVWRDGDLGLRLKSSPYGACPIISRFTYRGNATGLSNAGLGDELVAVNGTLIRAHQTYRDALELVRHARRPAILRFRRNPNELDEELRLAIRLSLLEMRRQQQRQYEDDDDEWEDVDDEDSDENSSSDEEDDVEDSSETHHDVGFGRATDARREGIPTPSTISSTGECIVCFDGPQAAVCVPCGHNAVCMGCAEVILTSSRVCPVCRVGIREVVKLYRV